MPTLTAGYFQVFLDEFGMARPDPFNVLVVDNSRCHTAKDLVVPANIVVLVQPPYAPPATPARRGWQAGTRLRVKDAVAWQCFHDLAHRQAHGGKVVPDWDADMLRSLTAYPCMLDAANALSP